MYTEIHRKRPRLTQQGSRGGESRKGKEGGLKLLCLLSPTKLDFLNEKQAERPLPPLAKERKFQVWDLITTPSFPQNRASFLGRLLWREKEATPTLLFLLFLFLLYETPGGTGFVGSPGQQLCSLPSEPSNERGYGIQCVVVVWEWETNRSSTTRISFMFFSLSFLRQIWSMNSYKLFHTFTEEHCRQGIFKNISQGVSQVKYTGHDSDDRIAKLFIKKNFVPRSLWTSRTACSRAALTVP